MVQIPRRGLVLTQGYCNRITYLCLTFGKKDSGARKIVFTDICTFWVCVQYFWNLIPGILLMNIWLAKIAHEIALKVKSGVWSENYYQGTQACNCPIECTPINKIDWLALTRFNIGRSSMVFVNWRSRQGTSTSTWRTNIRCSSQV